MTDFVIRQHLPVDGLAVGRSHQYSLNPAAGGLRYARLCSDRRDPPAAHEWVNERMPIWR